nr:uncharacterized protein C5orf34 homolog [Ciona intestinalis]|eukprot:XP_026692355.1 uncharacterized protein C5orf34 homolog [Ciona intestinalis]
MANPMQTVKELAEKNSVLQVLIFNDDSVEVQFKDRSVLQLSPCGANYQYHQPSTDGLRLVENLNTIRQRSKFATSDTKTQVDFAVSVRNLFAVGPYIAAEFHHLCEGVVRLHQDVTDYVWPVVSEKNPTDGSIVVDTDGKVTVCAKNDAAELVLWACQNQVEVKLCVKLNESKVSAKNVDSNAANKQYAVVKQLFSASCCPDRWKYPLQVALNARSGCQSEIAILNKLHAVKALPDNCPKPFKHQWRTNTSEESLTEDSNLSLLPHKRVKCMLFNGNMYWFFHNEIHSNNTQHDIEVWLNDGSILTGSTGRFHFSYKEYKRDENMKLVLSKERMYTPTALPMDEKLKNIILRVMRLCSTDTKFENASSKPVESACWVDAYPKLKGNAKSGDLGDLQSDNVNPSGYVIVPNLGKFSSAGGSVQVCFDDEATVHAALSSEDWKMIKKSSENLSSISARILLPNKRYHVCSNILNCDTSIFFYMKHVCEWLLWLVAEEEKRGGFYQNTIYCREKSNMVLKEIEKIAQFNSSERIEYARGQCGFSFSNFESEQNQNVYKHQIVPPELFSSVGNLIPSPVSNALESTGKAIDDISSFIENIRKQ